MAFEHSASFGRPSGRQPIRLGLIAACSEEPLEPELGDLVMPTDRGEHVDELAGFGESELAVFGGIPAKPPHRGALEQERVVDADQVALNPPVAH
jgi:hypothetical protein